MLNVNVRIHNTFIYKYSKSYIKSEKWNKGSVFF